MVTLSQHQPADQSQLAGLSSRHVPQAPAAVQFDASPRMLNRRVVLAGKNRANHATFRRLRTMLEGLDARPTPLLIPDGAA
ncbi:hypothetical protein ACIG47_19185 [Promicromonospora sp. NPDC052451]|uniref:hypothetical protein n=1 Tax=Promicromonospora sp. NPDC052451 TaxID=3364407 RepID=UPI0037C7D69F